MDRVTSKDGTVIAYDPLGAGPAVILVDGALQYRASDHGMAQLAELLARRFTVIHDDCRGVAFLLHVVTILHNQR